MTLKEAVAEASRRLGWSDERIEFAMAQAQSLMPMPKDFHDFQIPEALREQTILRFMEQISRVHGDPATRKRVGDRINKIVSNN